MKITINEVSKHAKVSKATISRYLNGKYEHMSEETKKRIEKVIENLGYVPNNIARGLKSKNTKIIGCMIADFSNQFSNYIFKGISEVCKKNGYRLLVTEISGKEEDEIDAIQTLLSYNVEGLIINTVGGNDDYLIELSKKVPLVLADRFIDKKNAIDTVTSDNCHAIENILMKLKEFEYTKVALFSYEISNSIRKLRVKSYLENIEKIYGYNGKETLYILEESNEDEYKKNIKEFLEKNKKERCAIFTVNGTMLLHLLNNLNDLGIDFEKEDIGICSFDDWGWARLIKGEGITTILQQSKLCGEKCTELLLERIKNKDKKIEYIELKTELKLRGSTKWKK